MKQKLISFILAFLIVVPVFVSAQTTPPQGGGYTPPQGGGQSGDCGGMLCNPISAGSIPELIAQILEIVVKIGAPVVIFFLVYVGFLFVTSSGNESKLTRAKTALVWTLIGGLILLGAQLLASVIQNTIEQIAP